MQVLSATSLAELVDKSNNQIKRIYDAGGTTYLVVPTHEWAVRRKLQLKDIAPSGVDVLTFTQLISQLWELFGDGTRLLSTQERKVLLRPFIRETGLLSIDPSPRLMDLVAAFVEEAIVVPRLPVGVELSDSESRLMELTNLYAQKLELDGLLEQAQAEERLLERMPLEGRHFIFEAPDTGSAHIRSFIQGLQKHGVAQVISQKIGPEASAAGVSELSSLRSMLYTGQGGLKPKGAVRVGISRGAHVSSELLAQLIEQLHQEGIAYDSMFIVLPDPASAHPYLHNVLGEHGIPFKSTFSLPAMRIGLGAAFRHLEIIESSLDDSEVFGALVSLISSPYSGVLPEDARALQMRWRERSQSTHEERMRDIEEGFNQGLADMQVTKERLAPLRELLGASRRDRVNLLFENAKNSSLSVDSLLDDRAAADALLDYIEVCEDLSCEPFPWEMFDLAVPIDRSFSSEKGAIRIGTGRSMGPAAYDAVFMPDLDASHYPMAAQHDPFHELLYKLGIEKQDDLASSQRIHLSNMLESAHEYFVFCRSTHDANGDESCQSALFEELLAPYRSQKDEDEGLPINEVPHELRPYCSQLDEAQAFSSGPASSPQAMVQRGRLSDTASVPSLIHDISGQTMPFSPTALEDYYRCPYRWFTSRRVGYNPMDSSFDASAQGNLVHAALERFYVEFLKGPFERVDKANLSEALDLASKCFYEELEHERTRQRRTLYLKTHFDEHSCEEMHEKVLDLIKRDSEFLPGFHPSYFELSLGHRQDGPLLYAGVPVRGKVDRIDVDDAGNAIIIDYKLSSLQVGYGLAKGAKLPQRIQTDIYATLVQRYFEQKGEHIHVMGSVYRSYDCNNLRGVYSHGIQWGPLEKVHASTDALPSKELPFTYDEYLMQVEKAVEQNLELLSEGDIEAAPLSKEVCKYCKALLFCPKAVN